MGHDKLRKFAENETFSCLLQPDCNELLSEGFFNLKDHPVKGHWFESRKAPLVLELGCGKGEYTIDLAQRNPDKNYIGVDIKGARLWRGAKTAYEEDMKQVAFIRTRIEMIDQFFAENEVDEIWVTFPDPQPKKPLKRLTSPRFLAYYKKFLKPNSLIHLKTDSQELFAYTLEEVVTPAGYQVEVATTDLYASDYTGEATAVQTFYESGYLKEGRPITYLRFRI